MKINKTVFNIINVILVALGIYNIQAGHPYIGSSGIIVGALGLLVGEWEITISYQIIKDKE